MKTPEEMRKYNETRYLAKRKEYILRSRAYHMRNLEERRERMRERACEMKWNKAHPEAVIVAKNNPNYYASLRAAMELGFQPHSEYQYNVRISPVPERRKTRDKRVRGCHDKRARE